jgi:hypothetical protein
MSEISAFISYCRESQAHVDSVIALSERLRSDGVITILDEYEKRGAPTQGWTRWMANNLRDASHVICVCTKLYSAHVMGRGGGSRPSGVDWEGSIIANELYACNNRTDKFIPVAFSGQDAAHVPTFLISLTCHVLDSEANYLRLYDSLMAQAGVEPGAVGPLNRKRRRVVDALRFPDASAPPDMDRAPTGAPPAQSSSRKLLAPVMVAVGVFTAAAFVLGQQYLGAAPRKPAPLVSTQVTLAHTGAPPLDPGLVEPKPSLPPQPKPSGAKGSAANAADSAAQGPSSKVASASRYIESDVPGPPDENVAVHLLPLQGQNLGAVTDKVRDALRAKGYRPVTLFKAPFSSEGLDKDMVEGRVGMLQRLGIAKYCDRVVLGSVRLRHDAVTEGYFVAEVILTLRVISAQTGEQMGLLEVPKKGSGATAEASITDALAMLETIIMEKIGGWSW